MENRSEKLLLYLKRYYKNTNNSTQLFKVLHSNDAVSLRLIDWLVTNYSKEKMVVYKVNLNNFNMHQNYKDMLKAYSQKLFDPFRRHDRIFFNLTKTVVIETTVAQLTFFKWAIDNDVLKYANKYKDQIKKHMDLHTVHRKLKFDDKCKIKQKRKELSKPTKLHKMNDLKIKLKFV